MHCWTYFCLKKDLLFQNLAFTAMAPSALPLPAAASKVARKEKETSRSNERFLKFAMIVFLGLFTYFTVGFASIG